MGLSKHRAILTVGVSKVFQWFGPCLCLQVLELLAITCVGFRSNFLQRHCSISHEPLGVPVHSYRLIRQIQLDLEPQPA
jgi:hypothetical protein